MDERDVKQSLSKWVQIFEVQLFFINTRTKNCEPAGYECATYVRSLPPSSIFAPYDVIVIDLQFVLLM